MKDNVRFIAEHLITATRIADETDYLREGLNSVKMNYWCEAMSRKCRGDLNVIEKTRRDFPIEHQLTFSRKLR